MVVTEEKHNIQNVNALAISEDAHAVSGDEFRVKISFAKSSSQYFGDALEIASEFEEYRAFGKGKEQRHEVDIRLALTDDRLWEKTRRLAQIVGNTLSLRQSGNDEPLNQDHGDHASKGG